MTTPLRTLFDYASQQVAELKHPNVDEFKIEMSKVLEAAGMGNLKYDSIEEITEYLGNITISTSWSARGCAQTSEYTLPASIIDSEDPVKAAQIWKLNKNISEAQRKLENAQKEVLHYSAKLEELYKEMTALN